MLEAFSRQFSGPFFFFFLPAEPCHAAKQRDGPNREFHRVISLRLPLHYALRCRHNNRGYTPRSLTQTRVTNCLPFSLGGLTFRSSLCFPSAALLRLLFPFCHSSHAPPTPNSLQSADKLCDREEMRVTHIHTRPASLFAEITTKKKKMKTDKTGKGKERFLI